MVCSSNLIFNDLSNLSSNGALHIQPNKSPPTDHPHLKRLLNNPEKLSWSQTKALKMSKPGSSWDYQRKSAENQRHQQFATLFDDEDEFLPQEEEINKQDGKDKEIEIVDYYSKKDDSIIHNVAKDIPVRNTVKLSNTIKYQPIAYNNTTPVYNKATPIYNNITPILHKLPHPYINHNPNNNNVYPKKVVRFQEKESDIQVVNNILNKYTIDKGESIFKAPLPPRKPEVFITGEYNLSLSGKPQVDMTRVYNAPLPSAPHVNMNSVYNAPLHIAPPVGLTGVYNAPLPIAPPVDMTSQTTKTQLAEHLRARKISDAIDAAISSPANRLPQAYESHTPTNSVMSNWSITQKLDHRTHEIMPLKLKLKKNNKAKDKNKRQKRCNKNTVCPLNCTACKNSHADGAKKKQPNAKGNKKEISFLELPEDGNYLIVRKIIEECPMCYSKLNIRKCAVNLKLLLYTYHCACGLTIFHIPNTPDNIPHPIKIIET